MGMRGVEDAAPYNGGLCVGGLGALREVRRVVIVKQAGPPRDGRLF